MSLILMTTLFYKALTVYKEEFDADHSYGLKGWPLDGHMVNFIYT